MPRAPPCCPKSGVARPRLQRQGRTSGHLCGGSSPAANAPLAGCAAIGSMQAPSWCQEVVNMAAARLPHPSKGPDTLSLSVAPSRAARGGEAEQQGPGWHGASPCPLCLCDLPQGSSTVCAQPGCGQGYPCEGSYAEVFCTLLSSSTGLPPAWAALSGGHPIPGSSPYPLASSRAKWGSVEKPSTYRSMMSTMVQANMRSPSGICRATEKRNSLELGGAGGHIPK